MALKSPKRKSETLPVETPKIEIEVIDGERSLAGLSPEEIERLEDEADIRMSDRVFGNPNRYYTWEEAEKILDEARQSQRR